MLQLSQLSVVDKSADLYLCSKRSRVSIKQSYFFCREAVSYRSQGLCNQDRLTLNTESKNHETRFDLITL